MREALNRRSVRFSKWFYQRLLALYPAGHRQEYGPAMVQLFTDQCCDAWHEKKTAGLALLWLRVLPDLIWTSLLEQITAIKAGKHGENQGTSLALKHLGPVIELEMSREAQRVRLVERDVMLLVKWFFIVALACYAIHWADDAGFSGRVVVYETIQQFFVVYVGANVAVTLALLLMNHLPFRLLQWILFASALLDGLLVASLTLVTGGVESMLYWLLPALIARNAIATSRASLQLILNFLVITSYVLAGALDVTMSRTTTWWKQITFPDAWEANVLDNFVLRTGILVLFTLVCWSLQALWEKRKLRVSLNPNG